MDTDIGLDLGPWLKSDFGEDILHEAASEFSPATATLGTSDLADSLPCSQSMAGSLEQAMPAEWLDRMMTGAVPSPDAQMEAESSDSQPFPGFPAAGTLTSVPISMGGGTSQPVSCSRNRERQQRFRQRQKAKIESLESQVVKLMAQTKALAAEKEDLGGRALKFQDLLQGRDRALAGMTAQIAQMRCGSAAPGPHIHESQQLTLTYCSPPLVLNGAQLSKMDGVDLAKVWKEYVWQLELLLPDGSSCQGQWTPTRERMDALTSELVQLMMHLWDSCPDFSRIRAKGLVDESMQCEDPGLHRWQQIAHLLSLAPDQMNSLVALRTSMNSRLKQIWATRREAHANMFNCVEDELPCSRDVAVQHHRMKVQTEIVKESLKQESLLARDFDFAFYKKVLTPDQRALCIVRGYPYFPDAQALANWIAALNGNQDANNLMTAHSSPSSTSFHSNS